MKKEEEEEEDGDRGTKENAWIVRLLRRKVKKKIFWLWGENSLLSLGFPVTQGGFAS